MKLCVLTYDAPHLKTSEVCLNLHMKGAHEIDFMIFPFTKRPGRAVVFEHRPYQFEGPHARALAAELDAKIWAYEDWEQAIDAYDYFLVCGAGLIHETFANSGKIINCHPGLLPIARGLDAFKWSILNTATVGNTLHIIDAGVDAGTVLAHALTPCFEEDDIAAFAQRHYKREIFMLSNFDWFMENGSIETFEEAGGEPTKRMSSAVEETMLATFEEDFKRRFARRA